jgi:hypothetical protein
MLTLTLSCTQEEGTRQQPLRAGEMRAVEHDTVDADNADARVGCEGVDDRLRACERDRRRGETRR